MKRALTIVFRLCLLIYVAVLFTSCSCKKSKIPTNDRLRFALSTTKDSYSIIGIGECIDNDIIIPSTYNGLPVTCIGDRAFENCSNLTSIEIPNSVTSIGSYAFYKCINLTSIEIPNSVEDIGQQGTFFNCSNLKSVVIGNSVTSIGYATFSGCENLTNVVMGSSITSIGKNVFRDCNNLTSIIVDKNNKKYDSRENCNAIIETSSNTLIIGCKNTIIPNSGEHIGVSAFEGCIKLTSIEIPNSVRTIGFNAFTDCKNLTNVVMGNGITSIGDFAFYHCYNLTNVAMGNGIKSIGNYAFCACTNLTSIEIPNSLISLGNWVFSSCSKLQYNEYENCKYLGNKENPYLILISAKNNTIEEVTISENTRIIYTEAFKECFELANIEIPNSVTSIGTDVFKDCYSLMYNEYENCKYLGNKDNPYLVLIDVNDSLMKEVTIHEKTRFIYMDALSFCPDLISVEIPTSVISIGDYAFMGCTSLASIIIPDSVTTIGNSAFNGCRNLTSIKITNSVTSIGNNAFYSCESLTCIVIPSSAFSIGYDAFSWCEHLTIFCEVNYKQNNWNPNWNSSNRPVYWLGEWEYVDDVPTAKK